MGRSVIRTRPFLDVGYTVIGPRPLALSSLDDIKGRRVAVQFGTTPQLLLAIRPGFRAVTFKLAEEAMEALTRGEADVAFLWGPTAGYFNKTRLGGAYAIVPIAGEGLQWHAAVGVRKGLDSLKADLDRVLDQLKPEINTLADKYGFPLGRPVNMDGQRGMLRPPERGVGGLQLVQLQEGPTRPTSSAGVSSSAAEGLIRLGRSLFNQHCSHCHAPNAASPEPTRDLRRLTLRYGSRMREAAYATIPVGKRPRGVAVSPDGRRVYVTNSNSDSLSVINAKTLEVLSTVPAGIDPEGLTVNRAGTALYVVNENELSVTVLDVASLAVRKKIAVGKEPETAVASPDGRWIAVSNETSDDVHVIATASDTVVKQIAVPKNPRGMRFTADSRQLFVASEQAHVVSVIDMAEMRVVKSAATGGSRPVDIVLTPDGSRLYVSHGQSGDVRVLDSASLNVLAVIPVGPRTWWTALSPDARFLYATVGRANELAVIDMSSNTVVARTPCGTLPWGVAIADTP